MALMAMMAVELRLWRTLYTVYESFARELGVLQYGQRRLDQFFDTADLFTLFRRRK